VDDRPDATVQRIVAQARALRHRDGDLAAVVVDYLGLLRTPQDRRGRWEHVGDISRALKNLAQSMHVPVIALAQLNRESVQAGKPRDPGLQDLRESGSIEQDADVVLLLQRRFRDNVDTGYVDVHVAKNRHGRIGRFPLKFQGWWARMQDTAAGEADERDTSEELNA
jgi:replicative DNA helicase